MGITSGTGMRSLPGPSPNLYRRGMSDALAHVGNTASVLSISLVGMMVSLVESPSRLKSPPL